MRRFIGIGTIAVVMTAVTVGASLAQDTGTDAPDSWLGVALVETDAQIVIARVLPDSPADDVGLLVDDIILTYDGDSVASIDDLRAALLEDAPGDSVTLEIERDDEALSVDVTLGTAPERFVLGANLSVDAVSIAEFLLNADLEAADSGYEVVSVSDQRNPFELQAGDVVSTINGQAVADLDLETLRADLMAENAELTVVVIRDGEEVTLTGAAALDGRGFGRENHPDGGFGGADNPGHGNQPGGFRPGNPPDGAPGIGNAPGGFPQGNQPDGGAAPNVPNGGVPPAGSGQQI